MKICIYIDQKGINGKPHIPATFDILFQTDKWIFVFAYGLQFTPTPDEKKIIKQPTLTC